MTPTSSYLMQRISQTSDMLIKFKMLIEGEIQAEHRKHGFVSNTFASMHYKGGNHFETFIEKNFELNEKGYQTLVNNNWRHGAPIMGCMVIFGLNVENEDTKYSENLLYMTMEDPIYSTMIVWREEVNPDNARQKILVRRPELFKKYDLSPNLKRFRTIIETGLALSNARN